MQMIKNEQAVTVTIESILLFSITVILLGMVMLSFQSINEQATETVMREQYGSIGNDIASKILDLDHEVKASLSLGSVVAIEDELDLKPLVANKPYSIELDTGKVRVKSIGTPSVTVEVPFDPSLNIVPGSAIFSTASEHILMYDPNGQIMFKNGGVDATVDSHWPIIYFDTPEAMSTLNDTATINVFTLDDIEIAKVEYFIDQNYEITTDAPWEWNTRTITDGYYTITAMAYDRAGHYSYDTRMFRVYNGLDLEAPTVEIVSPGEGEETDFNPPPIEVIVRDNMAIDRDTIKFLLDGEDILPNSNITNSSLLEYTLLYTPPAPLTVGPHEVNIYAKEMYYGNNNPLNQNVTLNWSFTVKSITDDSPPTVSLSQPATYLDQQAGDKISVQFRADDDPESSNSGIDYAMIYVTDVTDGLTSVGRMNVSSYEVIVYNLTITYQFDDAYVLNHEYSYNITVYDRIGNSYSAIKNNLTVRRAEAEDIIISTADTDNNEHIVVFTIESSGSTLGINGIDVRNFGAVNLKKIRIGTSVYYNDNNGLPDPANVSWFPGFKSVTTRTDVFLEFGGGITSDPLVTLHFKDGTSKTVTITKNP